MVLRRSAALVAVLAACCVGGPRAAAADIVYLHDELGRLARIILESGEAATYHYDPAGNILRITRESGVPQGIAVSSVSTDSLARGTTVTVTITGANLIAATLSSADPGITIQNVHSEADQLTLDVVVGSGVVLGDTTLLLLTELGQVSLALTVTPGPPLITGFSPTLGAAGTVVAIQGLEFDERAPANNQVLFNGTPATVTAATRTSLTALVPAGATSGPLTAVNAGGSGTSAAAFITGQVTVDGVAPPQAERGATTRVTVTGANLLATSLSRAGGTFANTTATATQVSADLTLAIDAPREGAISVSNQVTVTSIAFAVVPGPPVITSFAPVDGAVGDAVTLLGSGFDDAALANNVVRFNGVVAEVVSVEPTRLVAHVPVGATTGRITVTTSAGTATTGVDFTVRAAEPIRVVGRVDAPFSVPFGVRLSPDGRRAYVANQERGSVGVVDTASHTVVGTIPVGELPRATAMSADGTRLYVLNDSTEAVSVSVLDLTTNTLLSTVSLGTLSRGPIAVTPDGGTLYVVHSLDDAVSLIDTATGAITTMSVGVGAAPVAVRVSRDGAHAYVTDQDTDSVSVVSTSARAVVATIPVGDFPSFGLFTPDGSRFYSVGSATVTAIDTSTRTAITTFTSQAGDPVAGVMSADGARLYLAAHSSSLVPGSYALVAIDTVANAPLGALALPPGPFGPRDLAMTPDGQRLLVTVDDDVLTVVDRATMAIQANVALDGTIAGSVVPLSDSRTVYVVCSTSNTLSVVDLVTSTTAVTALSSSGAVDDLLLFTTAGDRAFGRVGSSGVVVAGFETATRAALPNIHVPRAPTRSFSQLVAAALDPVSGATVFGDNSRQILFMDTATRTVTGIVQSAVSPASVILVSPDGSRLYLLGSGRLAVVDVASRTQLSIQTQAGSQAVLSPDGTRLYVADVGAIKVFDPSGASPVLVATIPVPSPFRLRLTAARNELVVLNVGTSNSLSIIDTTANTVTGTVALDAGSYRDLVVSPTRATAFATHAGPDRVDVIDLGLRSVTGSVPLSAPPNAVAIRNDGATVFVVQFGTTGGLVLDTPSFLTAIDGQTGALIGTLEVRFGTSSPRVFAGTDGRMYVPVAGDSVLVLE